eukprot:TRINITY_DN71250_c0_g1_i1.p1 TRINITY_DN71250_c0_g1~~TRINITY_DN71250_c0_g1_i1.p1  ORF type:complete len:367 (-),score=55.59 TRINITY_DN71250_c0_g1_i1:17-1117(-)
MSNIVELLQARAKQIEKAAAQERPVEDEIMVANFMRWVEPRWNKFTCEFGPGGAIDLEKFEQFVRWDGRHTNETTRLFEIINGDGTGLIPLHVFAELRRRLEKNRDVKLDGVVGLKHVMTRRFGSLAQAWRRGYDPDDTGQCCMATFVKRSRENGFTGELRAIWVELTGGGGSDRVLRLHDWDPEVNLLLIGFCRILRKRYGSIKDGWLALLSQGYGYRGSLDVTEWEQITERLGFATRQSKLLFDALDKDQGKSITKDELRFIVLFDEDAKKTPRQKRREPLSFRPNQRPSSADRPREGWGNVRPRTPVTAIEKAEKAAEDEEPPPPSEYEFVVIMTKNEYLEYLRRRRARSQQPGGLHSVTTRL